MTLTDQICHELLDGLRTGMDYADLQKKWEKSKGPFYNALQRVFAEAATEISQLSADVRTLQKEKVAAQTALDALAEQRKKIQKEMDNLAGRTGSLRQQEQVLKETMAVLTSECDGRKGALAQVRQLDKAGFGRKELEKLQQVISDIGAKAGLKEKETVAKFFRDLDTYHSVAGFEREITRLGSLAETRRLEVEKWQAQRDRLETGCMAVKDAVTAVESLAKQGIQPKQVVAWARVTAKVGGVGELDQALDKYKSLREVLAALTSENKALDQNRGRLAAEVATLERQEAEITGAIRTLTAEGKDQISSIKEAAVSEIRDLLNELGKNAEVMAKLKVAEGQLSRELNYARYLSADPEALKTAPKQVAEVFLVAATNWCKLRVPTCRIGVPNFLHDKYYSLPTYGNFELLDLMQWVRSGLQEYDAGEH